MGAQGADSPDGTRPIGADGADAGAVDVTAEAKPSLPSFLQDAPDLGEDAFGHGDYSDALFSIVQDASPPRTVGLFGPWGVGKSTIIGGLRERLAPTATAFVYFDAWRYEDDSLRRQFLLDTAHQLSRAKRLYGNYSVEKELRELEVDTQELSDSLRLSWRSFARAIGLALVFGLIVLAAAALGAFDRILGGHFGEKLLVALAAAVLTFLASTFSQSVAVDTVTITRKTLRDPDQFTRKFRELLAAVVPRRLVIAVDNLDRSSPEKAIELLSTIKTYLEPTAAGGSFAGSATDGVDGKEVIFVIAVDDEALRRHLIDRERSIAEGLDALAARGYVDEYLAKFFSARLPVRTILGDDMRGYVEHHLGPLAEKRKLPDDERRSLIAIVESGLRGNPRGVKQFYNDLEARLRLLEERERAKDGRKPGISPSVSGQVAMVAKLALIEREWPDAFARLQEDPRLLAGWTRAARTLPAVDWNAELVEIDAVAGAPAAQPGPIVPGSMTSFGDNSHRSHREFASFLRIAATVDSAEVRALLSLKQSAIEVELPGFSEFREAILSGDREEVSEVLQHAAEPDRERLVGGVPRFLAEELKRRYLDVAREVLGATIAVPGLAAYTEVLRAVMKTAADDPELRRELVNLPAGEVLAAGELLVRVDRQRLLEPFLGRFHDVQAAAERGGLARAIAPHLADLSETQRAELKGSLAAAYRGEFADYLPLVKTDHDLLPPEAIDAALEHLAAPGDRQPQPQEPGPISTRESAAVGVIEIGLATGMGEDRRQRLVATIGRIFGANLTDGEALAGDLPILTRLIRSVELDESAHFAEVARLIPARWPEVAESARALTIEFAGALLDHCAEDSARDIAQEISGQLFTNPTNAFAVLDSLTRVPTPFREPFIDQLTAWAGRPEDWAAANDTLRGVDPEGFPPRAVDSIVRLLRDGHAEQAVGLLGRYPKELRPLRRKVSEAGGPTLVERIDNDNPGPAELLQQVVPSLSPEAREGLATGYAAALNRGNGEAVRSCLQELSGPARRLTELAAHDTIERLEEASAPALDFLAAEIGSLPKSDQKDFAEQVVTALRERPGRLPAIASALTRVKGLAAAPATEIVKALLERDRDLPELTVRRNIYAAVIAMRKGKATKVDSMLKARHHELTTSEHQPDRELAAELLSQIPA
jgi:low affinity Fe/Cu permease